MKERDPKIARNWKSERLSKDMGFLVIGFRETRRPTRLGAPAKKRVHTSVNAARRGPEGAPCATKSRLKAGCSQDWLPHKTLASGDSFHADQLAEDDAFERRRGGEARIAAAAAQGHGLDGIAVFVED